MPSPSFAADRCVPWLFSSAGVRVEGDPQPVAPAVAAIRARIPHRSGFRLKFAGVLGLFFAAIAFMTGIRPAEAGSSRASLGPAVGFGLGGFSVGAIAIGRRLERTSPALTVLCAGRGADLDDPTLADLVGDARKRLAEESWPEGHVWLISEAPLAADSRARAEALEVRCFTPVRGGAIAEV
jgi:hypothetical protein